MMQKSHISMVAERQKYILSAGEFEFDEKEHEYGAI